MSDPSKPLADERNPDHIVTSSLREHWHKIAALLLHKLKGRGEVLITLADMEAMHVPGGLNIVVEELPTGLRIQIVDDTEGQRLVDRERKKVS